MERWKAMLMRHRRDVDGATTVFQDYEKRGCGAGVIECARFDGAASEGDVG
jgi:hypothetical protein